MHLANVNVNGFNVADTRFSLLVPAAVAASVPEFIHLFRALSYIVRVACWLHYKRQYPSKRRTLVMLRYIENNRYIESHRVHRLNVDFFSI